MNRDELDPAKLAAAIPPARRQTRAERAGLLGAGLQIRAERESFGSKAINSDDPSPWELEIVRRQAEPAWTPPPAHEATRADVERVRDQLKAQGKPHGYGSIAKAGLWSVSTVIRRLKQEHT